VAQSILTVVSGANSLDIADAPAFCDPLVKAGLIESWRPAISVEGVALILKPGTTSEQRRALIDRIEGAPPDGAGLKVIESGR
jgi:hypothetical protein